MTQTTIRAPESADASGPMAMGTIGFDLYLDSLGLTPAALRPSKVPCIIESYVSYVKGTR